MISYSYLPSASIHELHVGAHVGFASVAPHRATGKTGPNVEGCFSILDTCEGIEDDAKGNRRLLHHVGSGRHAIHGGAEETWRHIATVSYQELGSGERGQSALASRQKLSRPTQPVLLNDLKQRAKKSQRIQTAS